MTQVFISYDSDDRVHAERFARALEAAGFDVWWDRDSLATGVSFNRAIALAIDQACGVIVIWSSASVTSKWVESEAYAAWKQDKLHCVALDDAVVAPMPFNTMHTRSFADWDGNCDADEFMKLLRDLRPASTAGSSETPVEPGSPSALASESDKPTSKPAAKRPEVDQRNRGAADLAGVPSDVPTDPVPESGAADLGYTSGPLTSAATTKTRKPLPQELIPLESAPPEPTLPTTERDAEGRSANAVKTGLVADSAVPKDAPKGVEQSAEDEGLGDSALPWGPAQLPRFALRVDLPRDRWGTGVSRAQMLFLLAWALVTALGSWVPHLLMFALDVPFYFTHSALAVGFSFGLTIGLFQWFALRTLFTGAWLWTVVSVFGLALGWLLFEFTEGVFWDEAAGGFLYRTRGEGMAYASVIPGVSVAIAQWFLLRKALVRAWLWILAAGGVWAMHFYFNADLYLRDIYMRGNPDWNWTEALNLGLFPGFLVGGLTGLVLLWILHLQPSRAKGHGS